MLVIFSRQPSYTAAPSLDQGVVVTVQCPGPVRNVLEIHELPVADIHARHTQVIARFLISFVIFRWAQEGDNLREELSASTLRRCNLFPEFLLAIQASSAKQQ